MKILYCLDELSHVFINGYRLNSVLHEIIVIRDGCRLIGLYFNDFLLGNKQNL